MRDQREAGRIEGAVGDAGGEDERRDQPRLGRPGKGGRDQDRGEESRPHGPHPATAVGEAAEQRIQDHLERRGGEEESADRDRSPTVLAEPERNEHDQDAEKESRQYDQPKPDDERTFPHREQARPQRLPLGRDPGGRSGPAREGNTCDRDAEKGRADADDTRQRAEHGSEQRAEDGGTHRRAEQLAAALAGRRGDHPGEPAGPRAGTADTLKEARQPQRPDVSGKREAEARGRHQRESDQDGRLGSEPDRGESGRNRAEERSGRVRRDEDAGAGLRQLVLVSEVRDQRRQRGEEQRVHRDDHADEDEQTAHGAEAISAVFRYGLAR